MIEELTAMFRVCKHIKRDGFRCNSPAMTGMNFCFHHIGGKVASLVREGATYDASAQLDFPYPADRDAIQHSLHLVAQALREAKIDNPTANTYTRIFRLAEQNLHRWEKAQKATGKTKMQPPADEATDAHPNTVVIPTEASKASEAEEPALSPAPPTHTIPTNTDEATPNSDVIPNEARHLRFAPDATTDGGPLKPPGGPLKPPGGLSGEQSTNTVVIPSEPTSPTDVIPTEASEAEQPALPPVPRRNVLIPTGSCALID